MHCCCCRMHVTWSGTLRRPSRVIPPHDPASILYLVDAPLHPSQGHCNMPPRQSIDKLLPPILDLLRADPPNPYSAHQKTLTTTARLVRSGQSELACEILFNVARELLKAGDTASGAELGVRMVDIMHEQGVKVDDKSRGECRPGLTSDSSFGHAAHRPDAPGAVAQEALGRCHQVDDVAGDAGGRPAAAAIPRRAELQG